MKKVLFIALGSLLLASPLFAETEARDLPAKSEASVTSITAKVTAIEKATRKVTLQLPGGESKTITAGPDIRNFDQINVGDDVNTEYRETISIFVAPPAVGALAGVAAGEAKARLGEKPAAVVGAIAEVRSSVEDINYEKREVTLKGPSGKVETFTVSNEVKKFDNVKKGDELVIRATESIAVSVNKVS